MVPEPTPEPGGGVAAAVGVRLLGEAGGDDPRTQAYIVAHLHPGEEIQRRIEVSNAGHTPRRIEVYPAAATVERGGFGFAPGRTGNELTEWVRVEPAVLDLPPAGRASVTATIAVPEEPTEAEHYGVVWAEVGPAESAGVRHQGRSGVRIYLSVGEGQEPASEFEIGGLVAGRDQAGAAVVSARVRNTGERALDLGGELALSDGPAGLAAGPYPVRMATLGIGASGVVRVPLDAALPEGTWRAELTLASGGAQRTATGIITIGSAAGSEASSLAGRGRISLAALTTAGLGGMVWLLRRWRRRT